MRIFTSLAAIKKWISVVDSPSLGVTFCQACCRLMGEDLGHAIDILSDRIFHFRNVTGTRENFRESFHDNGVIPMAKVMREDCSIPDILREYRKRTGEYNCQQYLNSKGEQNNMNMSALNERQIGVTFGFRAKADTLRRVRMRISRRRRD